MSDEYFVVRGTMDDIDDGIETLPTLDEAAVVGALRAIGVDVANDGEEGELVLAGGSVRWQAGLVRDRSGALKGASGEMYLDDGVGEVDVRMLHSKVLHLAARLGARVWAVGDGQEVTADLIEHFVAIHTGHEHVAEVSAAPQEIPVEMTPEETAEIVRVWVRRLRGEPPE